MMLPQGGVLTTENVQIQQQPSRTYRLDLENGRVSGKTDRLEAVKQAVHKVLLTERFRHLIYSANYGAELDGLIGKPQAYVRSELKRRVTEALMQDDRILDVVDFDISFEEEAANASFTVVSIFGSFQEEVRVSGI